MMKSYLYRIIIAFLSLFYFSFPVLAEVIITEEDKKVPFPYPAGPVKISNGYQGYYTHQGYSKYALDMQVPFKGATSSCDQYGVPVIAVRGGEVIRAKNAGEDGSFGTHLIIKSDKNLHIWYAHLVQDSLQVSEGDKVQQGQLLGLMGDTGNTAGATCEREVIGGKGEKIKKTLSGVHLHTEIRDGMYGETINKNFTPPIPLKYTALLGEKEYKDIVVGDYISTSLLTKDEKGYWAKMKDHIKYKLPDEAVGEVSSDFYQSSDSSPQTEVFNNASLAEIFSISPTYVQENQLHTFTITGKKLPKDLAVELKACQGEIKWLKRESEKQQFNCQIGHSGETLGFITAPNQKTFDNKIVRMSFDLRILSKNEAIGKTIYQGFPKVPQTASPGDRVILAVIGQNLPPDLVFDAPFCSDIRYLSRGLERQSVECLISEYAYDANGKLKNELISHGVQIKTVSGEIVVSGDLVLDHQIKIETITPPVAYFGQKVSFTLKGKNVHRLKTFHLDYCQNLAVLSQSSLLNQVVIECTLPVPEKFFSPLMPDHLKRKTLNLHVKDKPGGELILAGKIEAIATPESWVKKINPYYPILGKENVFTIEGDHLPDKLLYWMADCGQGEIKSGRVSAQFKCKSSIIGKNAMQQINQAALNVKKDPGRFMAEIEKQRRLVEVKYPREYAQDGKTAITVYRGYILPLPKEYAELYFSLLKEIDKGAQPAILLDAQDREEIISYILENREDYSAVFLKKMGWQNSGSEKYPLYQLILCPNSFKNRVYKGLQSKLNTIGCAKGLDVKLVEEELGRLYPNKT